MTSKYRVRSERVRPMRKFLVIVTACIALVLMAGLVACGSSKDQARTEYQQARALFDEGKYYSAKTAFEECEYADWDERAAACVQPMPRNGELFHDENMISDKMKLSFEVEDYRESVGRYITVYTKDKTLVEAVFIQGSGRVSTKLPGGEYYIKCATGTEWYGPDEQFGPDGHYETCVFDEAEGDRNLVELTEGYEWEITFYYIDGRTGGISTEENSWEDRA